MLRPEPPRYRIEWVDAYFPFTGWTDIEDLALDNTPMVTEGFLVTEDREVVVIASTVSRVDNHKMFAALVRIPKRAIVKRVRKDA